MANTALIKIVGVFIKDRKYLVVKDYDGETWKNPGGKMEEGETHIACLKRELAEELSFELQKESLEQVFSFGPMAAFDNPNLMITLVGYIVDLDFQGSLTPASEVEAYQWIDTETAKTLKISFHTRDMIMPK